MKHKEIANTYRTTYTVSMISRVGPYQHTKCFRLTLDEIKDNFAYWIRNDHEFLRISIIFDENVQIDINDFDKLCKWVNPRDK